MTQLLCAYSVRQERFWRCAPGELLLLRTDPLPRGAPPPRLGLRPLPLGPRRACAGRRRTLRPQEVDEEGLILLRLPPTLKRGLYLLRLCLGPRASAPRLLIVS